MSKLNELALAAGKGERVAMQELATQLQSPVWRFAYSLTGDRDLADEAAQETWVRVIRGIGGFSGRSEVTTWVLTITRRVVAGLLYRRKTAPIPAEQADHHNFPGMPELALELSRLPRSLMEPLVLTQVVGLTYQETGEVMGIKLGTVRSRVFRARVQIMEALGEAKEQIDGM